MRVVETPNLPMSNVKSVLISAEAGETVLQYLKSMNIEAITVPQCADIAPPVSSHPDMLFHHLGGRRMAYYLGADSVTCRKLEQLGFELTQCNKPLESQYPKDIAFNAARVNNYLFCNARYTDKTILDYCRLNNIHIISVNQGYAKCSVCIVDNNSIITSDKSIKTAATQCGINVLFIHDGFIALPGYDSGFIGGCCGKLAANKLFFCGNIDAHPDYNAIKHFCNERSVEICSLSGESLKDIGSIIPLLEND